MLMSLDISTKSTGVALFDNQKLIFSTCISCESTNALDRIRYITNEIEEIVKEYKPTRVIAEEPEPAFVGNNLEVYRKLTFAHGDICMMLNKYGLEMELCTSSHWRSLAGIKTGRGVKRSYLKEQDIKKVKELYNLDVNDDEADAILIGYVTAFEERPRGFNWG